MAIPQQLSLFPKKSTQTVINGDCLEVMKGMADNSIDFIVTDSPYGISFMSNHWDKQIPPAKYWQEMLRICKPGSHLCCAGLPRMIHRLGCIIEDSGWIIRDMIMHLFGSGFPKSHNHFRFEGYGTALKPAWEGWILAMKPLDGTFKQNAEKWGVAGINIDACRIPTDDNRFRKNNIAPGFCGGFSVKNTENHPQGRWPANLILSEEAAAELDRMTGDKSRYFFKDIEKERNSFFYCAKASSSERNRGLEGMPLKELPDHGSEKRITCGGGKEGFIPRENTHPTVKPIALMKYIIKLLAPPGSPTLLDPFAGSGSTLLAAKELDINAIGIELQKEYCEIAQKRLENAI